MTVLLLGQVTIRPAETGDLARVVEIYNAGIAERVATFETAPRTVGDISSWVGDGQPFIVAIDRYEVIGWARAGAYSDRCVYQGVEEHTVYVHPNSRGRGLGSELLRELCLKSERHGLYNSRAASSPTTTRVEPRTAPLDSRRSASNAAMASSTGTGKTASSSSGSLVLPSSNHGN